HCTITVLTFQIRVSLPVIKVPEFNIGVHLGKLLEREEGADVFFSVKGVRFSAHKWILAARSPVFRLMLLDQSLEIITIPDMEPKIFKAMLWVIYTVTLKEEEEEEEEVVSDSSSFMPKSFVGKILAAADQFELNKLKRICESRILKKLSGESVAYLLHLADLCHVMELKAPCLRFSAKNRDGMYSRRPLLDNLRLSLSPLFPRCTGYGCLFF
ncbi:BTB/POZ and math domain-containing protein 4, partial [Phtheirospermum japonicum]